MKINQVNEWTSPLLYDLRSLSARSRGCHSGNLRLARAVRAGIRDGATYVWTRRHANSL